MARLKRIASPKDWKISRKSSKYAVSPSPGPHGKNECLPLAMILRDYIKVAENMKEAKLILNKNLVKVNGKQRKEHNFPVGLMDILSVGDSHYRILTGKSGLLPKEISDFKLRLCRVSGKKCLKGGKVQINMSGGENMLVSRDKDAYKTGDVIVLDIEKGTIKRVLKLEKGALAIITGGKNKGKLGVVESIEIVKNPLPTLVDLRLGERSVRVPKDYVFVVGEKDPVIQM